MKRENKEKVTYLMKLAERLEDHIFCFKEDPSTLAIRSDAGDFKINDELTDVEFRRIKEIIVGGLNNRLIEIDEKLGRL